MRNIFSIINKTIAYSVIITGVLAGLSVATGAAPVASTNVSALGIGVLEKWSPFGNAMLQFVKGLTLMLSFSFLFMIHHYLSGKEMGSHFIEWTTRFASYPYCDLDILKARTLNNHEKVVLLFPIKKQEENKKLPRAA